MLDTGWHAMQELHNVMQFFDEPERKIQQVVHENEIVSEECDLQSLNDLSPDKQGERHGSNFIHRIYFILILFI